MQQSSNELNFSRHVFLHIVQSKRQMFNIKKVASKDRTWKLSWKNLWWIWVTYKVLLLFFWFVCLLFICFCSFFVLFCCRCCFLPGKKLVRLCWKGSCHRAFAVFSSKPHKYNSLLPLLVGNILLWTLEEDLRFFLQKDLSNVDSGPKPPSSQSENLKNMANFFKL